MRPRRLAPVLVGTLWALLPVLAHAEAPTVTVASLQGEVNAITASYLDSAVQHAGAVHAAALVVVTDTPGGLSTAMDDIAEHFLSSPVAVVVYVSPSGARDDSAGLFISQAADVLAMAPGTNIGSAHPVLLSPNGTTSSSGSSIEDQKVLNDAVARIRNLASLHHRNADWAEQAVRQSVNVSAEQAVKLHVADLEASSLGDLLSQLDGRTLERPRGTVTLHLQGARLDRYDMPFFQAALHDLISPDIAYLLLLIATIGIAAELYNPGLVLPGVAGVIAGVLALVALSGLPVNLAGLALVLFAIVLFVADLHAQTHGILTMGALISLVTGSIFLFNIGDYGPGLDLWLVVGMAAALLAFFGLVLRKVLAARRRPAYVGDDSLIGSIGEARQPLDPEGMVFVQGALWTGVAEVPPIPAGAHVKVVGRNGLRLQVAAAGADREDA